MIFDTDGAVDPSSWFTSCTINSSQRPRTMSLMGLLRDVSTGCTLLVQPPGITTIVALALASASLTWSVRWAQNESKRTRQCRPFVWGIRTSLIHFRITTWSIHALTWNVIAMSPSLCFTFFKDLLVVPLKMTMGFNIWSCWTRYNVCYTFLSTFSALNTNFSGALFMTVLDRGMSKYKGFFIHIDDQLIREVVPLSQSFHCVYQLLQSLL